MSETQKNSGFESWAIIEVMGHRRIAGYVTEAEIAGATMLRCDMPMSDEEMITQYIGMSAIFTITPTQEEIARELAKENVLPASSWELRHLLRRNEDDSGTPF